MSGRVHISVDAETFLDGKVTLLRGDCLEQMKLLAENSIDSCVTDPPYHLTNNTGTRSPYPGQYTPIGKPKQPKGGFMGKQWDGGDIAFRPELWREVFRVLKPGAHLLAFSGTRTYHRMACAIEDAGFEIRDQIGWCYGSGFPKSHDISKAIDRAAGAEREVVGVVDSRGRDGANRQVVDSTSQGYGFAQKGGLIATAPATHQAIQWAGWGTALKPAWEPIVLARKPLSESSIAANVLRWGTGAINIDGCRVEADWNNDPSRRGFGHGFAGDDRQKFNDASQVGRFCEGGKTWEPKQGRWPANLIHDGSEEVLAGFPETTSGAFQRSETARAEVGHNGIYGRFNGAPDGKDFGPANSGSAARFFYTAKADQEDRLGSKHPTVKPLDLLQYLIRLITPCGGTCLDPFAGTGTTGEAGWREYVRTVLIEREPEYQADIVRRMGLVLAGPDQRRAASVKQDDTPLPLFGGAA